MGFDPQITLIEGNEHREVGDPERCEIMELQPEVAKESLHDRVCGDPKPGEAEGDEGDDLRFSRRRLCCL